MNLSYLPCFILVLIIIPILELDKTTKAEDDVNEKYQKCNQTYSCGGVNITYPFYDGKNRPDYCGHPKFKISCNADDQPAVISTQTPGVSYSLIAIDSSSHTVSVIIHGFWNGACPANATDASLYMHVFNYLSKDETFFVHYGCKSPNSDIKYGSPFNCPTDPILSGYFTSPDLERQYGSFLQDLCQYKVTVPVNKSVNSISNVSNLQAAIENYSVELEWEAENDSCDECRDEGGECGWDQDKQKFACYCPSTHPKCYISRGDYWSGYCPQKLPDGGLIMNWKLFNLTSIDENVTFYYGCNKSHALDWMDKFQFSCPGLFPGPSLEVGYFMTKTIKEKHGDIPQGLCRANISVPFNGTIVNSISNISGLQEAFSSGFELKYYTENDECDLCWKSGGECGWSPGKNESICYCEDGTSDSTCGYGTMSFRSIFLNLMRLSFFIIWWCKSGTTLWARWEIPNLGHSVLKS